MNNKEKKLAAYLLERADEVFSNYGCNDVDESVFADWTKEERIELVRSYHETNGDPEEFNPDYLHLPDFALMWYMAKKLK